MFKGRKSKSALLLTFFDHNLSVANPTTTNYTNYITLLAETVKPQRDVKRCISSNNNKNTSQGQMLFFFQGYKIISALRGLDK